MKTRSAQLRSRDRKVLGWSIAIAALVHVAVFVFSPEFETEILPSVELKNVQLQGPDSAEVIPTFISVLFGPPRVSGDDGTVWREPPDRVLEVGQVLPLSRECARLSRPGRLPAHGAVRLSVAASGQTTATDVSQSSGDACADQVITTLADALWYRWLPSRRFPAPVDLVQPITLAEARN